MNIKYLDERTLQVKSLVINGGEVKEALLKKDAFMHVDSRHFLDGKRAYQKAEENASGMHGSFLFWRHNTAPRFHDVEELRQWIIQILDVFGYETLLEVLEERAHTHYGKSLNSMLEGKGIDLEFPCERAGLVYFSDHRSPEVANTVRFVFKWRYKQNSNIRDGLMLTTAYPVL